MVDCLAAAHRLSSACLPACLLRLLLLCLAGHCWHPDAMGHRHCCGHEHIFGLSCALGGPQEARTDRRQQQHSPACRRRQAGEHLRAAWLHCCRQAWQCCVSFFGSRHARACQVPLKRLRIQCPGMALEAAWLLAHLSVTLHGSRSLPLSAARHASA